MVSPWPTLRKKTLTYSYIPIGLMGPSSKTIGDLYQSNGYVLFIKANILAIACFNPHKVTSGHPGVVYGRNDNMAKVSMTETSSKVVNSTNYLHCSILTVMALG